MIDVASKTCANNIYNVFLDIYLCFSYEKCSYIEYIHRVNILDSVKYTSSHPACNKMLKFST